MGAVIAAVPADARDTVRALVPPGVEVRPVPAVGADVSAELGDVRFLVVHHERPDVVASLASLPALEVVQVLLAGTDWIAPHLPTGVTLCDARGSRAIPVAEWVLAALLGATSGLLESVRRQDDGRWDHFRRDELTGKLVLVIGMGSIGTALAERLEGLWAQVVGVARRARPGVHPTAALPQLVGRADAVVVLTPLTDDTRGMVDAQFLARLRDGALLINAARGAIVDTDALTCEVAAGRLRAVLDVVEPEPLPSDHALWTLPGAFLSPHLGGDSQQAWVRSWQHAGEQLRRFSSGEPLLNVVGPPTTS